MQDSFQANVWGRLMSMYAVRAQTITVQLNRGYLLCQLLCQSSNRVIETFMHCRMRSTSMNLSSVPPSCATTTCFILKRVWTPQRSFPLLRWCGWYAKWLCKQVTVFNSTILSLPPQTLQGCQGCRLHSVIQPQGTCRTPCTHFWRRLSLGRSTIAISKCGLAKKSQEGLQEGVASHCIVASGAGGVCGNPHAVRVGMARP